MTGRLAVRYEVDGGVAVITLDEPDNKNALSAAVLDGLGDALDSALADAAVRVLLVTNEGNTFCAGADLKAVGPRARRTLPDVLAQILDAPKPVVGRINGHCMGGGVGLAASLDISIATADARFGFTEVRLGVVPAIISVVCLPKLRRADALELFLSGDRIAAQRAADVGLINRAVVADELDAAIAAVVNALLAGGPIALAAAKRLIVEVPTLDRDEAFAVTAKLSAELFQSAEAAEGIAAFRERRRASWVPE